MRLATASLLLLICALAAPAQAQDADPIGALLQQSPAPDDEDAAERAGRPLTAPEPEPTLVPANPAAAGLPAEPIPYTRTPYAPIPYTPRISRPQLTEPVHIDELDKTPDAPPRVQDLAYESRLRSSFASAQGFQGALDGSWTLAAAGEGD